MTLWAGLFTHPDNVNTLRYRNLTKTEFGKGVERIWVQFADHKRKTHSEVILNGFVVEIVGVEPTTPCLQSRCSSQLSYTPRIFKNW